MFIVDSVRRKLGEGVTASICGNYFAFVDILLRRFVLIDRNFEKVLDLRLSSVPSSIFELSGDHALILDDNGICRLDFLTKQTSDVSLIGDLASNPLMRGNDGAYINNVFWFGTMQFEPEPGTGGVYVFDGSSALKVDEIGIPNSFINLGHQVLISDSLEQVIYSFDSVNYEKSMWLDLRGTHLVPDGGILGQNGNVYICMWGDGSVFEFNRSGDIVRRHSVPVLYPTKCCEFGGKLVVVSACPDELEFNSIGINGQTICLELG